MNLNELLKSKEKTIPIPKYVKGEDRFLNGVDLNDTKNDFLNGDIQVKIGQFFLYEKIDNNLLHYPKLGILLNILAFDHTIEVEWFDIRRSWEFRQTYIYEIQNGEYYKASPSDLPSQIQNLILWNDSMEIYGVWDKMPNWKELKIAYEKTIWYGMSNQDKRDRKLKTIL